MTALDIYTPPSAENSIIGPATISDWTDWMRRINSIEAAPASDSRDATLPDASEAADNGTIIPLTQVIGVAGVAGAEGRAKHLPSTPSRRTIRDALVRRQDAASATELPDYVGTRLADIPRVATERPAHDRTFEGLSLEPLEANTVSPAATQRNGVADIIATPWSGNAHDLIDTRDAAAGIRGLIANTWQRQTAAPEHQQVAEATQQEAETATPAPLSDEQMRKLVLEGLDRIRTGINDLYIDGGYDPVARLRELRAETGKSEQMYNDDFNNYGEVVRDALYQRMRDEHVSKEQFSAVCRQLGIDERNLISLDDIIALSLAQTDYRVQPKHVAYGIYAALAPLMPGAFEQMRPYDGSDSDELPVRSQPNARPLQESEHLPAHGDATSGFSRLANTAASLWQRANAWFNRKHHEKPGPWPNGEVPNDKGVELGDDADWLR